MRPFPKSNIVHYWSKQTVDINLLQGPVLINYSNNLDSILHNVSQSYFFLILCTKQSQYNV